MNITLVSPPQWSPHIPPLGLPLLTGYLQKNGYHVRQCDLNIEVYETILSPEYLTKIWNRVLERLSLKNRNQTLATDEQREYYSLFRASLIGRYKIDEVQQAKATLRDPEAFLDFRSYWESRLVLEEVLQMVAAAYFPTAFSLATFQTRRPLQSYDDFLHITQNEQENPFIELYKEHFLERFLQEPPDVLGVSIIGMSQVVPGLTFARLVKAEHPQTHIVVGGSVFTETMEQLKKCPELFGCLFDSIVLYEGEIPLLELCRCLSGGGDLSSVHNLVFKEDGVVKVNALCVPEKAHLLPTPDFDGLPLDLYLSPYRILPILSSRGCYWGKCAFCSHGAIYGHTYRKRPAEMVLGDLRMLTTKYSTKYFTFNDEAIAPKHLRDISEAVLSAGLEIYSTTDMRLDRLLTPDIVQTASAAGFKVFFFGLESGNDRVLCHMRKGSDIATAKRVLKECSDAGIWNHAFIFFGFPTEQPAEARETMDFVFANQDIIHSVGHSVFQLAGRSPARLCPDRYGISATHDDPESFLNLWSAYSVTSGLTMEQANEVAREFGDRVEQEYGVHSVWSRIAKDHILFFVIQYNRSQLAAMADELDRTKRPITGDELRESSLPCLGGNMLCGLADFDVAQMLLAKEKDGMMKRSGEKFFIMYDAGTGRIISTTLAAGAVLANCNGKKTAGEIAAELADAFRLPRERVTADCGRVIRSAVEANMCTLR